MAERIFHHGIFQMPFFASVFSYNGGQYSGRLNTVSDGLFNNEKDTPMRKPARGYARVDRVKEQIMRELAELPADERRQRLCAQWNEAATAVALCQ